MLALVHGIQAPSVAPEAGEELMQGQRQVIGSGEQIKSNHSNSISMKSSRTSSHTQKDLKYFGALKYPSMTFRPTKVTI